MKYLRKKGEVTFDAMHGFDIGVVFKREEAEKSEVIFERVPPGAKFPANRHPDIGQFYIIFAGKAVITVGDETFETGPGDTVLIPRNISHFLENPFSETVEYFCIDIFPEGPLPGHETWDNHWRWVKENL